MDDAKETRVDTASGTRQAADQPTDRNNTKAIYSLLRNIPPALTWCPPRCRWDPDNPPQFSVYMNILFGFAGAFTVANLYYNQPILVVLANEFNVPYEKVAHIPIVMQAGYAAGLLFLCPLGDSLPRRPFTLGLVFFTTAMWFGLCLTDSFEVFTAISFIAAITTVTPQIMLPLVGDLAPPERRASSLSIVVSCYMFGILVARVLSGTVTNYTSWRNVYWVAFGLQSLIFALLWLFMPDYPATNPALRSLRAYLCMLWSIVEIFFSHPTLVQVCLCSFFSSASFTNFWTTLTFLLASPPYEYSPLIIGLFALIGIAAMCLMPLAGRLVLDRLAPHSSALLGLAAALFGACAGTAAGRATVAAPVLQAFLGDLGLQTSQVANRAAAYALVLPPPAAAGRGAQGAQGARSRVNTAFMAFAFGGQLAGTAGGSRLYARGGWPHSGAYGVACLAAAVVVCLLKGPHETRWMGWRGGWTFWKPETAKTTPSAPGAESASELGRNNAEES